MIRAHVEAIIARLNEDPVLATCGFEGVVTPDVSGNRPQRYWTIYNNSGMRSIQRLAGPSATATFTYTFHWVGSEPDEAAALAERGIAKLVDFVPIVAGRLCGRLHHESSMPIQLDDDSNPPLYYLVDEFDGASDPV